MFFAAFFQGEHESGPRAEPLLAVTRAELSATTGYAPSQGRHPRSAEEGLLLLRRLGGHWRLRGSRSRFASSSVCCVAGRWLPGAALRAGAAFMAQSVLR